MSKSILQEDKESCFLCGSHRWLEEHHVFGGGKRQLSEKYGLKVYLCHYCHNEPPHGVHHNSATRQFLQRKTQRKAMERYQWTVEDFRFIFGKNYL